MFGEYAELRTAIPISSLAYTSEFLMTSTVIGSMRDVAIMRAPNSSCRADRPRPSRTARPASHYRIARLSRDLGSTHLARVVRVGKRASRSSPVSLRILAGGMMVALVRLRASLRSRYAHHDTRRLALPLHRRRLNGLRRLRLRLRAMRSRTSARAFHETHRWRPPAPSSARRARILVRDSASPAHE